MEIDNSVSYDIPADRKTWCERIERGCVAIETLFPPCQLLTAIEGSKFNIHDVSIEDRLKYLKKRLKLKSRSFDLKYDKSIREVGTSRIRVSGLARSLNPDYQFGTSFEVETWGEFERINNKFSKQYSHTFIKAKIERHNYSQ